jgi:ABC-type sugar transport system substrate-binding protein
MMRRALFLTAALTASLALAGAPTTACAAPVRHDHPYIGTWKITLPDGSCSETYRVRGDGSTLVFSNEEVAESTFVIADQPDKQGFYKSVDTIVKDNGKPDCTGQITKPGRSVTNYLLFHPGGDMFLMCVERSMERCIGPFVRVSGSAI